MRFIGSILAAVIFASSAVVQAAPTFADLAVLLARGYFKESVAQDASLEECIAFLNSHGVCFSMFDLIDQSRLVSKEDFARAIGQSTLLLQGESEIYEECIKRPEEIATWVDYCLLNDVDLDTLWNGFLQRTEKKSIPEVNQFFGRTF